MQYDPSNYKHMLAKPFISMWENWLLVLPATLFAVGMSFWNAAQALFVVETKLFLGLIMLLTLDLITGIYSSKTKGKFIKSLGLRQTGIKFVEYTVVCLAFMIVANMDDDLNFIRKVPFVFLALVEIKSIIENLSDDTGILKQLFENIKAKIESK